VGDAETISVRALLIWARKHPVVLPLCLLPGLLHGAANAVSDALWRAHADAGSLDGVRVSLLLHAGAWAIHSGLLMLALRRIPGFRAPSARGWLGEVWAFGPTVALVADRLPGIHGGPFLGFEMDWLTTPNAVGSWLGLAFLAFSTLMPGRWVVRAALPYPSPQIFGLARGIFGCGMVWAACVPCNALVDSSFAIPLTMCLFLLFGVWQAGACALGAATTLLDAPPPTGRVRGWGRWLGPPLLLWCLASRFPWNIPGLDTLDGIRQVAAQLDLPWFEVAGLYLEDRLVVAVTHGQGGYSGFCAQIECTGDCERYVRGSRYPGGNAGMSCSQSGVPAYSGCIREQAERGLPMWSQGSWSTSPQDETDYYLCGGSVLIAHDEYSD
jgi:hypothetical protein